jgi:hypothetical protein
MGCSAYVRDKVPLADVCICGGELSCDCYSEFCEVDTPSVGRFLQWIDALGLDWNLTPRTPP